MEGSRRSGPPELPTEVKDYEPVGHGAGHEAHVFDPKGEQREGPLQVGLPHVHVPDVEVGVKGHLTVDNFEDLEGKGSHGRVVGLTPLPIARSLSCLGIECGVAATPG